MRKPMISIPLGLGVKALYLLKPKGREHFNVLSHYLLANGKDLVVKSPRLDDRIRTMVSEGSFDHILKSYAKEVITPMDEYNLDKTLFYIWGKCYAYYNEKDCSIELTDRYVFYEWCGCIDHFEGCSCEKRHWEDVDIGNISTKLAKVIHKIFHTSEESAGAKLKLFYQKTYYIYIPFLGKISFSLGSEFNNKVTFYVSDKLFSLLGKEFNIKQVVKLDYDEVVTRILKMEEPCTR